MLNVDQKTPSSPQPQQNVAKKPNETGSISVQAHIRIFDPVTQKNYVEGRG